MNAGSDANFDHCRDLAKAHDLDRYLCATLAPKAAQPALFSLAAFNIELGMIIAQVSEVQIGQIRLQWWRDVLSDVFANQPVVHPVARALAKTVHNYDLPQHLFIRLIDGRELELFGHPFCEMVDLHGYCDMTAGSLTALASRVLIGEDVLELDFPVELAGRAVGIANRIEQFKANAAKGRWLLPTAVLEKFDVPLASVTSVKVNKPQELLSLHMANEAMQAVLALRKEQGRLSKAVLPAFLPVSLAAQFVGRVQKRPGFPLPDAELVSQLRKQLLLSKNAMLEAL